ncbi:ATP synthase subunit b [Frankliniella fusca]|uniref:ATP synthase subunit b n=1 Tax=Frankliniella fusca TaxID=407009 RepID=A0AAE1LRK4_9NEOP|nr:ATP synthase subunit b [Frankliniella fusca]
MTVSEPVRTWLWLLRTQKPLDVRQWLWANCVGSRGSQLLMLVANAMLLLAAVQAPSMKEAAGGTLMCCGFYSCNTAHAVYLVRRPRARGMLARVLQVADAVQEQASDDEKTVLRRTTRSIRWMSALELAYMAGLVGSVWAIVLVSGRAYAPMWPMPPLPGLWAERAVGWFEMAAMLVGCLAYFSLAVLFGSLIMALTGLYRVLSLRLQELPVLGLDKKEHAGGGSRFITQCTDTHSYTTRR